MNDGSDPVDELSRRREAVRELGQALRELSEAAVSTEVDVDTMLRVATQARELAAPLGKEYRTRWQLPSVDSVRTGRRMYSPAVGPGNPFAPPMHVEVTPDGAVGTCTLGLIHEGPHGYGHGGVSALLLDQILGHTHAAHHRPGMTVMLSVRYRAPLPLQTPLVVTGRTGADAEGARRSTPSATIATAEDPRSVLVEAEGTFVIPTADQLRRLFGDPPEQTEGMAHD